MAKVENLFEMVERALEGGVPPGPAMEQVAIQYADFSRETRKRLNSALDLARSGLRMELRAAAQERPPLVETADRLTSELALRWREYCKQKGLPVPAKITPAGVEELQLALAASEDGNLDQLHRLYRRQNLSRAAVFDRLQTLRRIARRDAGNGVWASDLTTFEAEAIREMRGKFAEAIKTGQLDDASELIEGLSREDWITRDAGKFAQRSQGELTQAIAKQARERAAECARDLYASYMAEAVDKVGEQLGEWNALCEQMAAGGLEAPSGAKLTVTPIIEWYEAREHQSGVESEARSRLAGLERLTTDTKASADEIQAQLIAAEQMPGGVPEDLRAMAERRVHEHTSRIRVRRTVRFVAVGAGCVAVLATAVWFVMGLIRAGEEETYSQSIAAAVGRGDAAEVGRLIARERDAKSGLDQLPAVLTSLEALATRQREEAEQDAEFDRQIAAAGDPAASPADSPAIEAAAGLARTDEQRERIARWREAQVAGAARSQQAVDAAFIEQVKALGKEIDMVSALSVADASTEREVKRVELLAARLGGATGIGRDARGAFDIQRRRLAAVRDSVDQESASVSQAAAHTSSVADVVAAAADPTRLGAGLEAFADANPDSPYARDFRDAVASSGEWEPVLEWIPLSAQVSKDPFPRIAMDRAARRVELEKYLKKYAKGPVSEHVGAYAGLLADGSGWTQWLGNIINSWPPMSMNMIELDTGERYYSLRGEEMKPTTTPGVDVLNIVMNMSEEKTGPMRVDRKRVKRSGPSPQAVLAEALRPLVKGVASKPSGEGALEALKMIREDNTIDPAARAYLINGLLPEALAALPGLSKEIERAIELLKEEDLETIDWMAPGIPSKRRDYKAVTQLLASALPIADWDRVHKQQLAATKLWLDGAIRPIGIFDRTAAPFTVLVSKVASVREGERLYAVVESREGAVLTEVGEVASGGAFHMGAASSDLPSGSPIFAGRYDAPLRGQR